MQREADALGESSMTDDQRFKLWFGPYKAPRFRYGSVVMDEVRGEVTIVDLSAGRIPWPIGKRGRSRSLIVYRGSCSSCSI
jgi:hypothetical protein